MDKKTTDLIAEHIVEDLKTYKVNTIDAIGILEVLKMALYIESTKGI